MSAFWLHDHIREVTLSQKKTKMAETARAVGREQTTIIMEYIRFRPLWSSNVELILHWDVCDQVLGEIKDIIYKCYRYRAESSDSKWRSRPDQTPQHMEFIRIYVHMESYRSK